MVIRGRVAPQPLKKFERISSHATHQELLCPTILAPGAKHSMLCVLRGQTDSLLLRTGILEEQGSGNL